MEELSPVGKHDGQEQEAYSHGQRRGEEDAPAAVSAQAWQ